ncbi:MAG: class B sortase [Clostridia bacterium]|nr:class B sortase [Clostridia bacterium]
MHKRFNIFDFFRFIKYSYLPNKNDNFGQVLIKLIFLLSLTAFIVASVYISGYFISAKKHDNIIEEARNIWHGASSQVIINENNEKEVLSPKEILLRQNGDFKGWIKLGNTKIDNPIYQTDNNEYYLDHNLNRKKSAYGALYFDCRNTIANDRIDQNLVIYGHEMKNGSMFGQLKKLRSLDFYKQNPTIEFSTLYSEGTYKIYSIFVLNAVKADDGGKIYNILGQDFAIKSSFDRWVNDALSRSLINTTVDVEFGDEIITLVTCTDDFPNARFVVMARKTRENESTNVDTEGATVNPNPKYPRRWYDERGLEYPFKN